MARLPVPPERPRDLLRALLRNWRINKIRRTKLRTPLRLSRKLRKNRRNLRIRRKRRRMTIRSLRLPRRPVIKPRKP